MAKRKIKERSQIQLFQTTNNITPGHVDSGDYFQSLSRSRIRAMEAVIQKLKEDDLNQGHCFMVTDRELSMDEAYYLYPDGNIKIEQVNLKNIEVPRTVVKVLNRRESEAIKRKHAFLK